MDVRWVMLNQEVDMVNTRGGRVVAVRVINSQSGIDANKVPTWVSSVSRKV